MKLVSACLAGINCRYDGGSKPNKLVIELVKKDEAVTVCPEQLGGLPIPRLPCEKKEEKVISKDGKDVTKEFVKGAQEGLKIAKQYKCEEAILKTKSASCGCGNIYDGTFSGKLIDGDGVFTKLLKQNGIKVKTENDL